MKIKSNLKDAVCSVCQRLVVNGCKPWNKTMIDHPAIGVNIDVSIIGWDLKYNPNKHFRCQGTDTEPEIIL